MTFYFSFETSAFILKHEKHVNFDWNIELDFDFETLTLKLNITFILVLKF